MKNVYLLSPDFDAVVELPFKEDGGLVRVDLPELYRYAMLYFSQGVKRRDSQDRRRQDGKGHSSRPCLGR